MFAIDQELKRISQMHTRVGACAAAMQRLEGLEGFSYAYASIYGPVEVTLHKDPALSLTEATSRLLRRLGVQTARKTFNDDRGEVVVTINTPDCVYRLNAGAPTRCKMEMVREEVIIPASAEHRIVRTKYKLVDPACLEGETSE